MSSLISVAPKLAHHWDWELCPSLCSSQSTLQLVIPVVLSSVLVPLHVGSQPFWCSLPGNSAEEQELVSPTLVLSPHATVLENKWAMRVLLGLGVGLIPWNRVYGSKLSISATLERHRVCSFPPSVSSCLGRSLETGSSLRKGCSWDTGPPGALTMNISHAQTWGNIEALIYKLLHLGHCVRSRSTGGLQKFRSAPGQLGNQCLPFLRGSPRPQWLLISLP